MSYTDAPGENVDKFYRIKPKNEAEDKLDRLINLVTQVTNMVSPPENNSSKKTFDCDMSSFTDE